MANQTLIEAPRQLSVTEVAVVPALIEAAGKKAKRKFVEFFTAEIENDNTRAAYSEACDRFLHWCQVSGITLATVESTLVAAYFKGGCPETREYKTQSKDKLTARSSKKQHLAAVRQMFDHLVRGGVLEFNPASSVRGPKLKVTKGKTPVLAEADARLLLESIDASKIAGLRDRAMIGCMMYAFARVSAVLAMNVDDLYENGRVLWLRLHEKGGNYIEMPAHHKLAAYLDAYINAAGIRGQKGEDAPLFRTLDRKRNLQTTRLDRRSALEIWKRRARQAGVCTDICNHTGRGTGLTNYMENGGKLEDAQMMAGHASARTTKMYVHTEDRLKQEEVERVRI